MNWDTRRYSSNWFAHISPEKCRVREREPRSGHTEDLKNRTCGLSSLVLFVNFYFLPRLSATDFQWFCVADTACTFVGLRFSSCISTPIRFPRIHFNFQLQQHCVFQCPYLTFTNLNLKLFRQTSAMGVRKFFFSGGEIVDFPGGKVVRFYFSLSKLWKQPFC